MLRRTWSEQIVGSFSFGMVFGILSIPAVVFILVSAFLGNVWLLLLSIIVAVAYLIALSLVQSALQSIFQAAVYLYAYNQMAPPGFTPDLLSSAMRPK
jgi:cellulose synthase/poly-beta-1,6-N-acetylglucosamine synthase-like glycosyltransferase